MGRILAQVLFFEIIFMIPALIICLADGTFRAARAFAVTMGIIAVVTFVLYQYSRNASRKFYAREGFVCVGLSWIVMSLMGCLPFWLSREIPSYVDAFFEMVSGFTTTGASIVPEVEQLSRGILYWRSFSHWLGGMGVLVFLLAVAPKGDKSGGFTMHLLRAESPGPNVGKLVPKMKTTTVILYGMYIGLTVLNVLFLLLGGLPLFDAVCTAFGTAGTGGFGIKNDSIAGYSVYVQNVCTVFMLLFGINFSCYYLLLVKQFKNVIKDEELRLYLMLVFVSVGLITYNIRGYYDSLGESLRHVFFQVASIITTTGFATTDFDLWPGLSKSILMFLMIIGASAGSTGGGLKCGRALLLLKNLKRNAKKLVNPHRVEVVRINQQPVSEQVLENTNTYLVAYVVIVILSILLVAIDGYSIETNISAVLACFNNIGPGFEQVGPCCNFASFGVFSKLVLIADMLAGRLEIFPILVLCSRSTWKSR